MNYGQRLSVLSILSKVFATISIVTPIIIVPLLAYKFNNWWLLFGTLISFLGSFSAVVKEKYGIAALITLFVIGFWMKSGFNIHQYVTFYYFCFIIGFWSYETMQAYNRRRVLVYKEIDEAIQHELTEGETGQKINEEIELKMKEWRDGNQINPKA